MIQIGTRIWITDDLRAAFRGHTHTTKTSVYFDGKVIGGVQVIKMGWDTEYSLSEKWCTVCVLTDDAATVEEFAAEMASHGFGVEIQYPVSDFVEFYHLADGEVVREEHRQREFKTVSEQ